MLLKFAPKALHNSTTSTLVHATTVDQSQPAIAGHFVDVGDWR